MEGHGLRITKRVPVQIRCNPANARYLRTKKNKMGHLLTLVGCGND